jgi:hypothetical protein
MRVPPLTHGPHSSTHLFKHEGHSDQRHPMEQSLMHAVQPTVGQEGFGVGVAQHILQREGERSQQRLNQLQGCVTAMIADQSLVRRLVCCQF